jgi:Bacterial toxin 46
LTTKINNITTDGSVPQGNELYQYTKVNTDGKPLRGKYYTDNPNTIPSELGVSDKYSVRDANWQQADQINAVKQEKITFDEANPVEGLKSTSAPIKDNWASKIKMLKHKEGELKFIHRNKLLAYIKDCF